MLDTPLKKIGISFQVFLECVNLEFLTPYLVLLVTF